LVRVGFHDVGFSYGRKAALSGVNWSFDSGVTGLLGPNGAGKTTLLSLLVTLTKPKAGSVVIGEHDLATRAGTQAARRLLGFVPQRFSLAPEMRAHTTVAYTGWMNGLARADCDAAAERALGLVGLADEAGTRVRKLSGGQRQRLGIAAALAHDPAVLVLDEPTVGLDPGQRLRVREVIAALGERRTVVLSSHLLEDIEQVCDTVGILVGGALAFDGSIDELHALIDAETQSDSRLGTRFERAYDALIAKLGGGE
jgi:ABC-2 type transport system ATP-binding protein